MGVVPGCPNAFLAAGHNCWGITFSHASGIAMAELILDGKSKMDLAPFSPQRFMGSKTGRGRRQGSAAVGEQW
jgi:glycine/D-amino acid oxidase-like deaminating enzyme